MEKVSHIKTRDSLSNRNLWTFAAGGIGRDMAYSLWNGSLLICIMYTKSVSAAQLSIIMVMMALCRIWDAVNDPVMGGIIERTRTKWGKFKPWIFIGAITNALVTFAIFAVPLQGKQFVIFFPFAYILWDITFTMNDIGYWAMMPSLTSSDEDRNKLSTWSNILAGIGSGIAGIIIPIATIGKGAIGGNAITGFTVIAAVIGLVFIGCQTMTCLSVKEKPLPPLDGSEKTGIKEMFKVIFKNKQLLWIALVMIFYNLGSSLYYASTTNLIYFRFGYEGGNASLFGTLGGLLGGVSILYPVLAKRFNRKQITFVAVLMAAIGYVLMFLIGSSTIASTNTKAIFALLILTSAIIVCGQTMFYMVQTISIANTIEYNEWKTGSRDEGIIFSVRPFMAKMGSALVAVVQLFVYGVWSGKNGMRIADYTDGISNLENNTNMLLANEDSIVATGGTLEQITVLQDIISKSGTTYADAYNQLATPETSALQEFLIKIKLAKPKAPPTPEFSDVLGKLKAMAIDNTLSGVENGAIIWMLFCLTIIPMVFVVLGYIVWAKKFKIDETAYAEMVTEIEARRALAEDASEAGAEAQEVTADTATAEEVVAEETVDSSVAEEVVAEETEADSATESSAEVDADNDAEQK